MPPRPAGDRPSTVADSQGRPRLDAPVVSAIVTPCTPRSAAALDTAYDDVLTHDVRRTASEIADFTQSLHRQGAHYADRPAPTFLKPYLLTAAQQRTIRDTVNTVMQCVERVLALSAQPELARYFQLPDDLRALTAIDPRTPGAPRIGVARLDGFFDEHTLRLVEINVDSPAGAAYADVQESVLVRTRTWNEFVSRGFKPLRIQRCHRLFTALLNIYRQWQPHHHCGVHPPTPTIAITDWSGVATAPEFTLLANYFTDRGCPTLVVDPREFTLAHDFGHSGPPVLTARGQRIDLVYRRALVPELAQRPGDAKALIDAATLGAACIVNPFCSRLASSKLLFELLGDPRFDRLFTPKQNAVRMASIAWTHRWAPEIVTYRGQSWDLLNLVSHHREKWVLKPANGLKGVGVVIGHETPPNQWDVLLNETLKRGDYVVQEYVPIPTMTVPILAEGQRLDLPLPTRHANFNPFAFGGVFGGAIARLSSQRVINVAQGGGAVPVIALTLA